MIVPLVEEHLTAADMGVLGVDENFKGDKIWLILGMVWENLSDQQRDMVSERVPSSLRQWWETVGEASFNDMIAEVRRTG